LKPLLLILSILVLSCGGPSEPFQLPENAAVLISGDSVKTWKLAKRFNDGTRMNMGDCFMSYRVSYATDSRMWDNNKEHKDCGESLEASWKLITNEDASFIKLEGETIARLLNIKDDFKYFKILALSENELVVQFKHQQFSSSSTIIVDHLVPEDVVVEDRAFHHK
jgi:hypothetical protein